MDGDGSDLHELPSRRTFVVQLHAQADPGQDRFAGRIEHIVSGRATRFASAEELLSFIARTVAEDVSITRDPR